MDPQTREKAAAAIASPDSFDELDPHGEHHHGHVIVRLSTLVIVLAALLVLTVLTVGQALTERWLAAEFGLDLPNWVNVAVVMAIATVKGALVVLFFMQLKYDNPINSIIFVICLFTALLFIVSTMTDLGTRGLVYREKDGEILVGGTQFGVMTAGEEEGPSRANKPVYLWARERAIEQWGEEKFKRLEAENLHGAHAHEAPAVSSPDRSVPRTGLSGALDGPAAGGHGAEDHGAGGH